MVKVAAPCLSLDASGSIAGAMTYAKWKGRPYVRQLVKPANPKSAKQTSVRAMFKYLSQTWKLSVSALHKATWNDLADAAVISPFNAFLSHNMTRWRSFQGCTRKYPATEDDATPSAFTGTPTGGIRLVTISLTYDAIREGIAGVIHRSTEADFTAGIPTVVALAPLLDPSPTPYIDTPLAAGTYYYRFSAITEAGKMSPAGDDFPAVVTDV